MSRSLPALPPQSWPNLVFEPVSRRESLIGWPRYSSSQPANSRTFQNPYEPVVPCSKARTWNEFCGSDVRNGSCRFPWTLSVWPQNPDPAIAAALDTHSAYLDSPRKTDTGFRHALALIGKQGTSIHSITASALLSGLAMKNPLHSTLATDAMIAAISDDRLSLDTAVKSARELCDLAVLTEKNWLKSLKVIANESEGHLIFVRDFLESIVDAIAKWEHAGFIELLYEYSVLSNKSISSKRCRKFLESAAGTGKAAKLAKKLLNM